MTLRERVSIILDRPDIPIIYQDQLHSILGVSKQDARRCLERYSRVVPIRDVIEGIEKPAGFLLWVISDHRDGFLIHLRESIRKS
ncbi:MAG: hypothetical protein R2729_03030 [Bryobacteraceae bacterium]